MQSVIEQMRQGERFAGVEPTATERVKVSLLTDRSGCLLGPGKEPRSQRGGCCRVSARESHRVEKTTGLTLRTCKKQDGRQARYLIFEFPESWGGMRGRSQQVSVFVRQQNA